MGREAFPPELNKDCRANEGFSLEPWGLWEGRWEGWGAGCLGFLRIFPGKNGQGPGQVLAGWAQALRMCESEPHPHPRG